LILNNTEMKRVICIGSSSKDIFFPVEGGVIFDTPEDLTSQQKLAFELGAKFQADEIYEAPGGCAANVAQGLSRLGIGTLCYTKIGADSIGRWIKKELKKEKVNTSLFQVDKNCKSDLSAIIVDKKSKEHLIFFNRDANANLEINKKKLSGAEKLFVSALNGNWEKHFDDIMEVAQDNEIGIIFNPGQRNIADNPEKIIEMIEHSEILILNKDEAIGILINKIEKERFKETNQEKFLLEELKKMGPRTVVLTDGENGAWSFAEEGFFSVTPRINPAEIVDTLGAGDSFASGFLAGIFNGKRPSEALKWGIVNSSEVIKHYGAKTGLVRIEEIENLTAKIKAFSL